MTNKFLSKGTRFRPESGPPASTDHVSLDKGIGVEGSNVEGSNVEGSNVEVSLVTRGWLVRHTESTYLASLTELNPHPYNPS
jgi:hypothetical protein